MKWKSITLLLVGVLNGLISGCEKPAYTTGEATPLVEQPSPEPIPSSVMPAPPSSGLQTSEGTSEFSRQKALAIRKDLIGRTLQNFSVGNHRFESAIIGGIDDEGVHFELPKGNTILGWDEFPKEQRLAWGYDNKGGGDFSNAVPTPKIADPRIAKIQQEIDSLKLKIERAKYDIEQGNARQEELQATFEDQNRKTDAREAARAASQAPQMDPTGAIPAPPRIGGISTSKSDRKKLVESIKNRNEFHERQIALDQARLDQLQAMLIALQK
jgi:hypothetical protein